MTHFRSNDPEKQQHQAAAIAEAAERIGDGSQLTPADFGLLTYAERVALKQANPEAYEALAAGRQLAGGKAWRPTTHGATVEPKGATL